MVREERTIGTPAFDSATLAPHPPLPPSASLGYDGVVRLAGWVVRDAHLQSLIRACAWGAGVLSLHLSPGRRPHTLIKLKESTT